MVPISNILREIRINTQKYFSNYMKEKKMGTLLKFLIYEKEKYKNYFSGVLYVKI